MTNRSRFFSHPLHLLGFLGGAVLLWLTYLGTTQLQLGDTSVHLDVFLLLLLCGGLGLVFLKLQRFSWKTLALALLPIGAALLLRVVMLDHQTHDYQTFLAQWAAFFRENGGFDALRQPVGDYNVPYLYFMAAISYFPWMPDLYAIKLFSILFDFILAWGGVRLLRAITGKTDENKELAVFSLLLLLPTVLLNGSAWGQCDALYAALVVHAIACVIGGKGLVSVILLAVAFSFKLQTIFLIPLWGVLWAAGRIKFSRLLAFPVAYAATIAPALWMGRPLEDILGVYVRQAGQYVDRLTFNAPSVFALLPYDLEFDTVILATAGILAAFLLCLLLLIWGFALRNKLNNQAFLAAAAVLAIGVPFLLPYMHERYFFLADVICLIWVFASPRRWPVALAVELSSLSSYFVYLRLKFTLPVAAFGHSWSMGVEALLMLFALLLSLIALHTARRIYVGKRVAAR